MNIKIFYIVLILIVPFSLNAMEEHNYLDPTTPSPTLKFYFSNHNCTYQGIIQMAIYRIDTDKTDNILLNLPDIGKSFLLNYVGQKENCSLNFSTQTYLTYLTGEVFSYTVPLILLFPKEDISPKTKEIHIRFYNNKKDN